MLKLIILTTSIIRGDFHTQSIGKFYDYFYKYLLTYKIYHIINIDEPEMLKKHFNKNETMQNYTNMIPSDVNIYFINEPQPGFLQAYKKIITKIEELNLIHNDYLYYWLEDDWEPQKEYDIIKLLHHLNFNNSAYTITNSSPLGSFRGGPFMTGSYFKNIFNIKKYMNNTCDPEKQMQRWLRGGYQKNGNTTIHRLNIINDNIDNNIIHIIIVFEDKNININMNINIHDINIHFYDKGFDKSIKFIFHILTYNDKFELQHSIIENNTYHIQPLNDYNLNMIFNNNCIKYFIIKPSIMFDIGRQFNLKHGLIKWTSINDLTGYSTK